MLASAGGAKEVSPARERWVSIKKRAKPRRGDTDPMKYLVIYEKSINGWAAYVPDLPGLGIAGSTLDEVKQLIREAIDFHLEGMRKHGDPIPEPSVVTEYVSVN